MIGDANRSLGKPMIMAAIGILFAIVAPQAAESIHWSYTGETGPAHWAELAPEFAACGTGVNQSPVDIVDTVAATLEPLEFDYSTGSVDIVNNGHTLQVNAEPGSWLRIRGEIFQLLQLHFHSPSEHQINGEAFPLEAHFVHQDEQGTLAVVSVLFRDGVWNKDLERIGMAGPETIGQSAPFDIDFQALELYRRHQSYFRYSGSLTTPPCTEGVRWYILKSVETIAPEQAANFVALIGKHARGPQPLNARVVLER
jgi:carbonic anhydrase